VTTYRDGQPVTYYRLRHADGTPKDEIQLSRVTYKLSADKAKAMATLLAEVKATVMEIKVDGEKLIVTTTPEAQQIVAQIVHLLLARPGDRGGMAPPVVPPRPAAPPLDVPSGPVAPPRPAAPPVEPPDEPAAVPPPPLPAAVPRPPVTGVPTPAYPAVASGSIKSVDGRTGEVLISIVGERGPEEGAVLMVYRGTRGPKCLGSVKIIKVTETEAVATPNSEMADDLAPGDWLLYGRASH
jgi:hypothetical protein